MNIKTSRNDGRLVVWQTLVEALLPALRSCLDPIVARSACYVQHSVFSNKTCVGKEGWRYFEFQDVGNDAMMQWWLRRPVGQ